MSLKVNIILADEMLDINSQTVFNTYAPHCDVNPTFNEDLCNKLYVDSRVSSGGASFLYLNHSLSSDIVPLTYKQLGTSLVTTSTEIVTTNQLNEQLIASFITNTGVPYVTSIPSGIWELNQYGMTDGNTNGTLYYFFRLFSYNTTTNTPTPIGTSGLSSPVIAKNVPDLYFAILSTGVITLGINDRLLLQIYNIGTNTGPHTLNSYYQGENSSYFTGPLLTNANLLTSNNTWIGTNSFSDITLGQNKRINFFSNNTANPVDSSRILGSFYGFTSLLTAVLPSQSETVKWIQIGSRTSAITAGVYILSGYLVFEAIALTTINYIWLNFGGAATLGDGTVARFRIPAGNIIDNVDRFITININTVFAITTTLNQVMYASASPSNVIRLRTSDTTNFRVVRLA